jgi:heme-degrading monooxygenase HmoA
MMRLVWIAVLAGSISGVAAFGTARPVARTFFSTTRLQVATDVILDEDVQQELTEKGLLKRDRYVATNRFAVRSGKEARFEARWATRKSRLATLDGFRYFHLMRRVTLNEDGSSAYDEGDSKATKMGNYVSFTIWEKKSHFSAWRNGDAFIEAHGGTSIGAFMSTMLNSLQVLKGAPKPAFYDGLLLQSTVPDTVPEIVDGWRNVEADGVTVLPTEVFVACNQFFVSKENAKEFEQRWAGRTSKLQECEGFIGFTMLRRDGTAKGHGVAPLGVDEPSYLSTTLWKDRAAFDAWKTGSAFKQAHGEKKVEGEASAAAVPVSKPLWSKPPTPIFYEGTLVIASQMGA